MEEIEEHPERNQQLKAFTANREIEQLIVKINDIYQARQQERIVYQRRETQIRREILHRLFYYSNNIDNPIQLGYTNSYS